jgi:N-sulfoglucosamine sulfohydrolase
VVNTIKDTHDMVTPKLFPVKFAAICFAVVTVPTLQAAAAKNARPNILFAIADDASYPHMGAYGCTWVTTPGFDRVARQGLLFTHAYTPNAKCAPSRASILTGRNSWQLEEAANHWCFFPAKFKVYTEALAEHGYQVGMTGKGWAPGIASSAEGKTRHLAGTPFQERTTRPPASGISNRDYAANFHDFLDSVDRGRPWCFWYGGHEPHRRYEYGSGIAKGGKKVSDIEQVLEFWPDNETVRTDMLDYAYEIEYFDRHLVRMLTLLEERGELANTLVVVTADNGMPFPRVKGQKYEMSNHLPLAIMWPAGIRNPGRTIEDYVSFIDFAPTFIELAGLKWAETGMHPSPGRSLTDIFSSERSGIVNPARDHILVGKERHDVGRPHDWGFPVRGIVKGGMLYLRNFEPTRWPAGNPETGYLNTDGSPTKTVILDGRANPKTERFWQWSFGKRPSEELYNVAKDPLCLHNLADRAEYESIKAALRDQAFTEMKAQNDPRMFGRGYVFDEYPYADDSGRSFYERYMRGEKLRAGWVNPTDFEKEPLD